MLSEPRPGAPSGPGTATGRRCAVWGAPVAHSLSPVMHQAAYRALGLRGWSYERREVTQAQFEQALAGLDESWQGLSLTMPLKEAALAAAVRATATATRTGAANTLVRAPDGWTADNTDVHGVLAALAEAGCPPPRHALVIGSGATGRSALAALAQLGVGSVTFMVRDRVREQTLAQARQAAVAVDAVGLGQWVPADVVVSTVPPESVTGLDALPGPPAGGGALLEVVYGSGRTPLQHAAARTGWVVVDGTRMLLHQAAAQVELMTGRPAPVESMSEALAAALAQRGT